MAAIDGSRRRVALVLGASVVALGSAWAGGLIGAEGPERALAADLEPFDSCEEVLDYVREHAWARDPYLYGAGPEIAVRMSAETDSPEGGAVPVAAGALGDTASDSVGPSATGTNVQESGVDEPDIAKLDGETLYVSGADGIQAFDVSGEVPRSLGRVELPRQTAPQRDYMGEAPADLLLAGDRLLAITTSFGTGEGRYWGPLLAIHEIAISEPGEMRIVTSAEIEGGLVSARLRGEAAHLVVRSSPDYPVPYGDDRDRPVPPVGAIEPGDPDAEGGTEPDESSDDPAGADAGEEPGWLPRVTVTDAATDELGASGPIARCEEIAYPSRFSGLGLLTVLTVDMEEGLPAIDSDAVMTDGETVYASQSSLYVATPVAPEPPDRSAAAPGDPDEPVSDADIMPAPPPPASPAVTAIHRFDIADSRETRYTASGDVDGRLLGQFSISEHDGDLRVAATEGDVWARGADRSESAVTVLREDAGELRAVGKVSGLGEGERIYAVRFIGELGYVVTFRETDPLYVVDLSDPAAPQAVSELKIPGYSAYLHPVGAGLLLGIGQDGTESGELTGAAASLFDISDPSRPTRIDKLALSRRWGQAEPESDHHAFLFDPARGMAVVPVTEYGRARSFGGAVAMRVDPDGGLDELGRFEDGDGYEAQIRRTIVVGDRLITVSGASVVARDLETLTETGSAPLGR